jgi:hypothetical protein
MYYSVQEMQPLKCMSLPSSNRSARTFQVGELVVDDQVNCFSRVLMLDPVIYCCSFGPNRRSVDQRQEYSCRVNPGGLVDSAAISDLVATT